MPQVGVWVATAIGATGTTAALVAAGVNLAINYAISKVTQPKGPKAKDVQTEIRSGNAERLRHLGVAKVSGAAMFWDWKHQNGGRTLYKLLAVGQGGITGVSEWWLNDTKVNVDPNNGNVLTAPYEGVARLRWRMGRDDEPAGGNYPTLRAAFSEWTVYHKLGGIGTFLGEFDAVKAEKIQDTYPGGDPQISAVIFGDKCHIPGGAPVVTRNVARQLRDVLSNPVYGCLSDADLDTASWQQAISDCDDPILTTGGVTRPRYAGGGSYAMAEPVADVAERISDACAGQLFLTPEGKVGFRAGVWRPPVYTITPEHIVAISIGAGTGQIEPVTTLVPKYTARETGWQETSADPVDHAPTLALFGEVSPKDIDLPWVQHHGQARRIAKIKLAKMNPEWVATVRLRFWGLLLLDQESVYLTAPDLGFNNEPFWIDKFSFDLDSQEGFVSVRLIHADPSSFSGTVAEEGEPPTQPAPINNAYVPPPLSIDSVQVVRNDGPPFIRISVSGFGRLRGGDGRYRAMGSTVWTAMQREETEGSPLTMRPLYFRTGPLEDRRQYQVQVRTTGGLFEEAAGGFAEVSGVEVFANETPPDAPIVLSHSGTAGGSMSVTFAPDVGVNYYRTGLYRAEPGQVFASAIVLKWSYATSTEVTMTAIVPAGGGRFWLRSENESGVPSAAVLIGQYT